MCYEGYNRGIRFGQSGGERFREDDVFVDRE